MGRLCQPVLRSAGHSQDKAAFILVSRTPHARLLIYLCRHGPTAADVCFFALQEGDMTKRALLGTVLVVVFGLVVGAGQPGEQKVPLDKVPKAVLDTVKARFPNA